MPPFVLVHPNSEIKKIKRRLGKKTKDQSPSQSYPLPLSLSTGDQDQEARPWRATRRRRRPPSSPPPPSILPESRGDACATPEKDSEVQGRALPPPLHVHLLFSPRLAAGATPSLLTTDPGHCEAVLLAARSATGNCLRETHLDLAVPGQGEQAVATPVGPVIHCGDSRLLWLVIFGVSMLR
jgi:hypothetical protein